jgi:hypothetical protein
MFVYKAAPRLRAREAENLKSNDMKALLAKLCFGDFDARISAPNTTGLDNGFLN